MMNITLYISNIFIIYIRFEFLEIILYNFPYVLMKRNK
jgi:hypothetical protein